MNLKLSFAHRPLHVARCPAFLQILAMCTLVALGITSSISHAQETESPTGFPRIRLSDMNKQRTKDYDRDKLNEVGERFHIDKRYTKYEDVLKDPNVDFVHINSPIPDHAPMSIAALKAGKHVMCTVPMATTVEECRQICELVKTTARMLGTNVLPKAKLPAS